MEIRGLTVGEFDSAVSKVSAQYGHNLITHPDSHDVSNTRPSCRARVWVGSSREAGARRSWSGRRLRAACWHAYRDVLTEVFNINPDAVVVTGLARYNGREGFESTYPGTAYTNIGSQMAPVTMPELCDC